MPLFLPMQIVGFPMRRLRCNRNCYRYHVNYDVKAHNLNAALVKVAAGLLRIPGIAGLCLNLYVHVHVYISLF